MNQSCITSTPCKINDFNVFIADVRTQAILQYSIGTDSEKLAENSIFSCKLEGEYFNDYLYLCLDISEYTKATGISIDDEDGHGELELEFCLSDLVQEYIEQGEECFIHEAFYDYKAGWIHTTTKITSDSKTVS